MPIYEYRCEACGGEQEAIQRMSDAPLRLCVSCGKEALMRVMSRTSFVLKGSGWYATDYKPQPKEAKAESGGSKSATAETSSTVSEAKPTTPPTP